MLAELMRMKYGVAVGGSHGKTTTTCMVAAVLQRGGLDPTIVVGGRLQTLGTNALLGHGRFLVAEADESDGSFLRLAPAVTVITNIDREHLDHYNDLDDIRQAFTYFANRVPFYGVSILCVDDPHVRDILPEDHQASYALRHAAGSARCARATLELLPQGARFQVEAVRPALGALELHVPGHHNVLNALAAVTVGLEVEVGFALIAEALAGFRGVGRRFETRGEARGRARDRRLRPPPDRNPRHAGRGAGPGRPGAGGVPAAPLLAHRSAREPNSDALRGCRSRLGARHLRRGRVAAARREQRTHGRDAAHAPARVTLEYAPDRAATAAEAACARRAAATS